jgi:hypothetical protein
VLVLAVFGQTADFGFVNYDDDARRIAQKAIDLDSRTPGFGGAVKT